MLPILLLELLVVVQRHHQHSSNFLSQQISPGAVVPSTPSPVSVSVSISHLHQQPPPTSLPPYQQSLSPSLTADDVSQAFSDDSCVFMPEYEQLTGPNTPATTSAHGGASSSSSAAGAWGGPEPYYSTVKTEDLGLRSLTACSLEASLPGYTTTTTSNASTSNFGCKMEMDATSDCALSSSS